MAHAPQIRIPATYMRGGTSKGVFFRLQDLPEAARVPGADAVNCTDSGWSPGLPGKATRSGTETLRCAGMTMGRDAGVVIQSWPDTRNDSGPV